MSCAGCSQAESFLLGLWVDQSIVGGDTRDNCTELWLSESQVETCLIHLLKAHKLSKVYERSSERCCIIGHVMTAPTN